MTDYDRLWLFIFENVAYKTERKSLGRSTCEKYTR